MQHAVNLSKPKIIFAAPNTIDRVSSISAVSNTSVRTVVVFGEVRQKNVIDFQTFLETFSKQSSAEFVCAPQDTRQNVSLILCSSGTTGLPKGVQLTQSNVSIGIAQHL